jgi:hypothetical protein
MNLKHAKRIRRLIERHFAYAGIPFVNCADRELQLHVVDSIGGSLWDTKEKKLVEGKALQWRLSPVCPRAIYRKVKKRVSTARKQGHPGLLRELRGGGVPGGLVDGLRGVEHTGAASVQREHEAVPVVQGMGVSDPAEGQGSDSGQLRVSDVSRTGEGA